MAAAAQRRIGRPDPKPLEIEVFKKFNRWDTLYAEATKNEYPHLQKGPPKVGDAGLGSVRWVGLNPDPCKAKFFAKYGHPAEKLAKMERAQRKAQGIEDEPPTMMDVTDPGLALPGSEAAPKASPKMRRSASVPSQPPSRLAKMSSAQHFLEQRYGHPAALSVEAFGTNGVWTKQGGVTPDDLHELMYFGVSKDGKGRYSYLKARRTLLAPSDKTELPQTAAHEVGWHQHLGKPSRILPPVKPGAAKCVVPA